MALHAGNRLGRYEVLGPLGTGGMGEVYRARDTRLEREVAIKILPESVARDPDRLARFDRDPRAPAGTAAVRQPRADARGVAQEGHGLAAQGGHDQFPVENFDEEMILVHVIAAVL